MSPASSCHFQARLQMLGDLPATQPPVRGRPRDRDEVSPAGHEDDNRQHLWANVMLSIRNPAASASYSIPVVDRQPHD